MNELWSKLGQRHEHKPAVMQSRMRQRQKSCVARLVAIEKKIKIDYARTFCHVAGSSEGLFHSQQSFHDFFRTCTIFAAQLRHHIQIIWLCERFHRLSLIDLRESAHLESCGEHPAYSH